MHLQIHAVVCAHGVNLEAGRFFFGVELFLGVSGVAGGLGGFGVVLAPNAGRQASQTPRNTSLLSLSSFFPQPNTLQLKKKKFNFINIFIIN